MTPIVFYGKSYSINTDTPMESEMFTKALIPTNGIWITESFAPRGYTVATYDAKGFATSPRWFASMEAAQAYAVTL